MFLKLKKTEEMLLLEPGCYVIKFPIDGSVSDDINLSDENQFLLYEVHTLNFDKSLVRLKITNEDLKLVNNPELLPEQGLSEYLVIVEKNMRQLIEEGVWWWRPD